MVNKDNAHDFVLYFQKRLLNLESKEGQKFRDDYEEITATRLTADKGRHLSELLDNAHGDFERVKMVGLWAGEHVSPTARKRFLTAQRQKKAKAKASFSSEIVTMQVTDTTHYTAQTVAKETAPELAGLRQSDVLELLVRLGHSSLRRAKKEPGSDIYSEAILENFIEEKSK